MEYFADLEQTMNDFSSQGAFLTVKAADGRVNSMAIAWGYIGYSWGKPFFITMVRQQRFTHDLLDTADSYTVSIPAADQLQEALAICGSKSGRDVDKAELAGLTYIPARQVSSPVVAGCQRYYECKISYVDTLHTENLPEDIVKANYKGDYHDLYFGEIVQSYAGEE